MPNMAPGSPTSASWWMDRKQLQESRHEAETDAATPQTSWQPWWKSPVAPSHCSTPDLSKQQWILFQFGEVSWLVNQSFKRTSQKMRSISVSQFSQVCAELAFNLSWVNASLSCGKSDSGDECQGRSKIGHENCMTRRSLLKPRDCRLCNGLLPSYCAWQKMTHAERPSGPIWYILGWCFLPLSLSDANSCGSQQCWLTCWSRQGSPGQFPTEEAWRPEVAESNHF